MGEIQLPYEIKPKVFNKGFRILTFIILAFSVLITVQENIWNAITFLLTIGIIVYSVIFYLNKRIIVESYTFHYKGAFVDEIVQFSDIKNITIGMKEINRGRNYYLMIEHEKQLVISNIQMYKKEDINFLVNKILRSIPELSICCLDKQLNGIRWVLR